MTENAIYKKNARKIKRRAIGITILFYALVMAGIAMASSSKISFEKIIPEPLKEWIKSDDAKDEKAKRPQARA